MNITNKKPSRGRPRKLSIENGLLVAREQFLARGFDNVSIAELCTLLSIPATSLYAAFGSKEKLFLSVFERYEADFFDSIETAIPHSKAVSEIYRNSLEASLNYYLNINQKQGCLLFLGSMYCSSPNIVARIEASQSALAKIFKNAIESTGTSNAQELSMVLITLIRGMAVSATSTSETEELYTALEFLCSVFE